MGMVPIIFLLKIDLQKGSYMNDEIITNMELEMNGIE